jgi:hypothetical protein
LAESDGDLLSAKLRPIAPRYPQALETYTNLSG